MRHTRRGFALLILVFAIAAMGLLLAGIGQSWQLNARREKETQLLFVGKQFSRALESYQKATPVGQASAPASLDDLVEDKRFPYQVRHLRQLYRDPMTGKADWQVMTRDGRIVAVYSNSDATPLRQPEALPKYVAIPSDAEGEQYRDWKFVVIPRK
jgi:type II secretory pathway pseudopilin PulG